MSLYHLVDFFVRLGDKLHGGALLDVQVELLAVAGHDPGRRRQEHHLDAAVSVRERMHDLVGSRKVDIL